MVILATGNMNSQQKKLSMLDLRYIVTFKEICSNEDR